VSRVSYDLSGGVATIVMDDGKVNALSLDMLNDVMSALDRAAADDAVVVFAGRDGRFSAGFDLGVITGGGAGLYDMLRTGFLVAERLLTFERPVVVACTGHAIAMAVFLLLSGDYRIGADGPFKVTANEVAIGLTMPKPAVELCRQRLTPAAFNRAVNLAEVFTPAEAVSAGFLDRVVEPSEVLATAQAVASGFTTLDRNAHAASKARVRDEALARFRAAMEEELPARN
jgi:enoyl-CoA hydratase